MDGLRFGALKPYPALDPGTPVQALPSHSISKTCGQNSAVTSCPALRNPLETGILVFI